MLPFTFTLPMIKRFTWLLVLLFCSHLSSAQTPVDDRLVSALYTAGNNIIINGKDTTHYYLIRIKHPNMPTPAGLRLLKRVNYNYYIASSQQAIASGNGMESISTSNALWKATPDLARQAHDHPNRSQTIRIALSQVNTSNLVYINRYGIVTNTIGNMVTLKIKSNQLLQLLQLPDIKFAGPERKAHTELAINDIDLGLNNLSAIPNNYPGIDGSGINVSVKEEKYDETDLDLLGRSFVTVPAADNVSAHATIMATLIGGNGNSFIQGLGAAPKVKFTSANFARLMPDSTPAFINNHISVQNHSYGVGIENFYGPEAAAYDEQVYNNDFITHVFSSGNIGTTSSADGVYSGIPNVANLSGTFKQAKNVIVVGGTGRTGVPEALSSSGPAYDGRVKPELVADGEDGTSGASALASGTVALLQQAYQQKFNSLPSSALLKTVLINSADDIGAPAVDHKTGYGKLNALEALRTINDARFKTGAVVNAQQNSYQITVPANCKEIKVSLAWADPAAALNSPTALVNDLDLYIITPNNTKLLPWVLSTYPATDSLLKPAARGRDSLNNTEQVTLQNPAAGVYTIFVKGSKIISGTQAFYIAYQTPPANKFEWTYPSGNDQLFANGDNYLRWQSSFNTANGTLSISYNHGANWQQIVAGTALNSNYYQWPAPNVFTQAMLKMSINGEDFISKEFTLSQPRAIGVGYNCTDGTLLHWNPQPGATGYTLYTIKNNLLQLLTTVTDTMAIVPASMRSSNYYAISAQGAGFTGMRSYTIDATLQGVGCYVRALLATVVDNKTIALSLDVGSTLNLKSIIWQKLTGLNLYTNLGSTNITAGKLSYSFVDTSPKTGINYYRVILTDDSGSQIFSDLTSATLLQTNQFTLFPNPVTTQLTILAGDQKNYELKLYDSMGRVSLTQTFNSFENNIPINLIPGIYMGTISLNGKLLYQSKIVKAQ
jgi:hypothetical protein